MTTRAYGVTEFGAAEVLRELQVPVEALGLRDVRVRVGFAAVNPTDTLRRAGVQSQTGTPAEPGEVPGMDIAGEVLEIGEDVDTGVRVGELVMGIVAPKDAHGAYRADIVVPARSVTTVPSTSSDAEAATVPMNALTAQLALDTLALPPGSVFAVTGAAGALGGYAIELAKEAGLTVVADAKDDDVALVRSLGADVVVPRGDDVAAAIRRRYPDGVDGLLDGSVQLDAVLPAVKDGGGVATIRGWSGDGRDRVRVTPVMVREYLTEWEKLDRLRQLVEAGRLTPRVAEVLPAADAAEAHRRLEAGGVRGRIVLAF